MSANAWSRFRRFLGNRQDPGGFGNCPRSTRSSREGTQYRIISHALDEAFETAFHSSSTVVSDGLHCFTGVGNAGWVHQPIITGSGRKATLNPAFKWVNTTLGNIKSAITGTYRAIRDKHVPRYLAE